MSISTIECPFCLDGKVGAKPGKSECPTCHTEFEIDDRVECVFVDLENPRIPMKGVFCSGCGLVVQRLHRKHCSYCGARVWHRVQ